MNKRLREIVQYKTNGKRKEFAALVGWTPQYLGKLLHGDDFGLKPVLAVLKALPEINARWLLTGEGQMMLDNAVSDLHAGVITHIKAVLDLERFIPVMSQEELTEFQQVLTGHKAFTADTRAQWIARSAERIQERKEEGRCRQRTARK
jgi:hypothetical protein